MKKGFILFVLSLLVTKVIGQVITADEMITKTRCKSFDCFNNYIINKGFSFEKSYVENDPEGNSYLFSSDENHTSNNPEVTTKDASVFMISKDGKVVVVEYRTVLKRQYQKLYDSFASKGFIIETTTKTDNGISMMYRAKQYHNIYLNILIEKLFSKEKSWTSYDIKLCLNDSVKRSK